MTDNIFFDRNHLRKCGKNVIIGKTVRIRYPHLVEIEDDVIIDDFVYISSQLRLDRFVHIASGCKVIGGPQSLVTMANFSTLAPNVVLAAGSDDYIGGIASPMVAAEFKGNYDVGEIHIGRHCIVGANSTVLPNVRLDDGAAVGAQSMVKSQLAAWSLYAGTPARLLKARDQQAIEELERKFWESKNHD